MGVCTLTIASVTHCLLHTVISTLNVLVGSVCVLVYICLFTSIPISRDCESGHSQKYVVYVPLVNNVGEQYSFTEYMLYMQHKLLRADRQMHQFEVDRSRT